MLQNRTIPLLVVTIAAAAMTYMFGPFHGSSRPQPQIVKAQPTGMSAVSPGVAAADDASTKSLVRNAAAAVAAVFAETGDYAAITPQALAAYEPSIVFTGGVGDATLGQVGFQATPDGFVLSSRGASGVTYALTQSATGVARTCGPAANCTW